MDSSSAPSFPTPNLSTVNAQSIRQKFDPAWAHVTMANSSDEKKLLLCSFCEKVIKGEGINRMKMHLAGQSGGVAQCKKVPNDVRYRMLENIKEVAQ